MTARSADRSVPQSPTAFATLCCLTMYCLTMYCQTMAATSSTKTIQPSNMAHAANRHSGSDVRSPQNSVHPAEQRSNHFVGRVASGRLLPGVCDHVNSLERREIELRIVKAPGHIFSDRRDRDLTATLDRISAPDR
jgi:hypothetical protein